MLTTLDNLTRTTPTPESTRHHPLSTVSSSNSSETKLIRSRARTRQESSIQPRRRSRTYTQQEGGTLDTHDGGSRVMYRLELISQIGQSIPESCAAVCITTALCICNLIPVSIAATTTSKSSPRNLSHRPLAIIHVVLMPPSGRMRRFVFFADKFFMKISSFFGICCFCRPLDAWKVFCFYHAGIPLHLPISNYRKWTTSGSPCLKCIIESNQSLEGELGELQ